MRGKRGRRKKASLSAQLVPRPRSRCVSVRDMALRRSGSSIAPSLASCLTRLGPLPLMALPPRGYKTPYLFTFRQGDIALSVVDMYDLPALDFECGLEQLEPSAAPPPSGQLIPLPSSSPTSSPATLLLKRSSDRKIGSVFDWRWSRGEL